MRIFFHYGVPMRVDFRCHRPVQETEYLDPYAIRGRDDPGVPTSATLSCACGAQATVTFSPGEHGGVEVLTSNVSVKQSDAESERA